MNKPTLGVIVGNRGFFPDHLCDTGRKTILKVLAEEGIQAIALTPEETRAKRRCYDKRTRSVPACVPTRSVETRIGPL